MNQSFSPKEEARKNEIIAAATTVFFEKGFSRTSMDDVIGIVGGSKRTLYKYFPSKDELFFAVAVRVSDRTVEELRVKHSGDLQETLTKFGMSYLRTVVSPEGLSLFRAVISEAPHLPKLGESFLRHATNRISQLLVDYFETQEKISDPISAAEQFLALVRGPTHYVALLGGRPPSDEEIAFAVRQAVATFLYGAIGSPDTNV
ncbi:transcriptional regulator [Rhizobium grahamii CCGE 502]|uniref:Transcriptional regulator n=2 Tax=Rhizobium grahamii TaxID=1120045 RepID=S3INY2_9HYPH|nr:transcriptional regulator [Rhizobium grahamii CCGE 502]